MLSKFSYCSYYVLYDVRMSALAQKALQELNKH